MKKNAILVLLLMIVIALMTSRYLKTGSLPGTILIPAAVLIACFLAAEIFCRVRQK